MTRATIRMSDGLMAALEARASSEARSVSNTARLILSRELGVLVDPEASSKPKTRRLALK
jgi:plasmid stability protein